MAVILPGAASLRRLAAGLATLVLFAAMLVAVLAADTGVALADCGVSTGQTVGGSNSNYSVGQNCSSAPAKKGGATGRRVAYDPNAEVCRYVPAAEGPYAREDIPAGQTSADGRHMDRICGKASEIDAMAAADDPLSACTAPCGITYGRWVPNAQPSPREVATSLLAQLGLAAPEIHTSPEWQTRLVVGVPTWLWIDGKRTEQTASDGPVSITARQSVKWTTSEGTVPCDSPGTPYVEGQSDPNSPSPDCGWTFRSPGQHTITATVTWTVTFTAPGGGGTLAPSVFERTQNVTVDEVQTVNKR